MRMNRNGMIYNFNVLILVSKNLLLNLIESQKILNSTELFIKLVGKCLFHLRNLTLIHKSKKKIFKRGKI